ncbi:MAG: ABC transporter permease [Anaerolineaceae bacterium]|nr:ABC transporter permease [Anaerolineaceae bacterium]
MTFKKIEALIRVELKKLLRDPMQLAVLILMPLILTLFFYLALGDLYQDPAHPEMSHFEYLVPGTMGYAVIYMGMMIALSICDYRDTGLLKRLQSTPISPYGYLGSLVIANVIIAVFQGLIVLFVSLLLGFDAVISLPVLLLTTLFLALLGTVSVGFGLITAAVSKSTGAASGLSMIFIVPMMVFGTFLAVFDERTYQIARFTPNFYLTDSLSRIFHGAPLSDPAILTNLLILWMIALAVLITGIEIFRHKEFR